MATPMTTGFPEALDLTKDYQIEFTALDVSTGADVTSVVVSNVSLLVASLGTGDLTPPTLPGEPEWLNLPVEG